MAFWMFMVAIGLAFAVIRSTRAGYRAVRGVYRRRRDEGHGALGAIAAMTAALVHGTPLAIRAARDEWPNGWRAGRRYAYQRFNRPLPEDLADPEPAPEPTRTADGHLVFGTDPTDPTGVRQCGPCQGTGLVNGLPCPHCQARQQVRNTDHDGRPGLRLVVDNSTTPAAEPGEPNPTPVPTIEGADMTVASAGIEVVNLATLILKTEADKSTAAIDLESAAADEARKREMIAEAEKALASAINLQFPADVVTPLKSLLDAHTADLQLIQRRKATAEHARTVAALTLDNLKRHQAIQDAAAAAGGMAHREAYVGG